MSKQIIIDWQRDGLIVATGSQRSGKIVLDKVNCQPIVDHDEQQGDSDPESELPQNTNAEMALHRAVAELGGIKGEAIVIASREIVELRTVTVPRVEASELPDIIRFQAQRQLSNMGDSWALDYILLPDEPGQEMLTVLAGVISPAHLAELDSVCTSAGLSLENVALRPIETARFALTSAGLPSSGRAMVVSVSETTADFMIVRDGRVVQVRGTKLPASSEQFASAINGEIRRSLMAASSQLGNEPLTQVVLIAAPELAATIEEIVADATGATVAVVDPASVLPVETENRHALAHLSGPRISAMAGAVVFSQADKQATFDFKNPKKRPPKEKKTVTYVLAASAAALLLIGGVFWWRSTNAALDEEIQFTRARNAEQKESVAKAELKVKELKQIENFLASSPNWLDEVTYIAKRLPPANKVKIANLQLNSSPPHIRIGTVYADRSETISELEAALLDEDHIVHGTSKMQISTPVDGYTWQVTETISLVNRGWTLDEAMTELGAANDTPPAEALPETPTEAAEATGQEEASDAVIDESEVAPPGPASQAAGADGDSNSQTPTPAKEASPTEESESKASPPTPAAPVSDPQKQAALKPIKKPAA
ncbi:type IV pilus biogenesis protein PilM [Aureliella helgolandensis]|uniref:Competence protein A n=1 Tax=Aureliella helgolandensis TaxID=2527968 RepID=A0A518G367_9BACT|nr:hypothetical protein [Aureliella helgolandensis]QDV22979.1 hypothetical protein Q31a_12720 [Aureliella helgolandensis]